MMSFASASIAVHVQTSPTFSGRAAPVTQPVALVPLPETPHGAFPALSGHPRRGPCPPPPRAKERDRRDEPCRHEVGAQAGKATLAPVMVNDQFGLRLVTPSALRPSRGANSHPFQRRRAASTSPLGSHTGTKRRKTDGSTTGFLITTSHPARRAKSLYAGMLAAALTTTMAMCFPPSI